MQNCVVEAVEDREGKAAREIIDRLVAFNNSRAEAEGWESVTLTLKDGNQALVGGLKGYTHWGWLFVSHLWVDERVRGAGCGAGLMRQAEEIARQRGCKQSHLDTFSFQAREFYEKQGYQLFGVLENYPPGHSRFFLKKEL